MYANITEHLKALRAETAALRAELAAAKHEMANYARTGAPQHLHQQLFHNMWQLHLLFMHHRLYTSPNNHITNSIRVGDVDVIAGEDEGEIIEELIWHQQYPAFHQLLHLQQHPLQSLVFQQHQHIWLQSLTNLLSRTLQNSTTIGICVFRVDSMYLLGTPVKLATCQERTIKLVVLMRMHKHT
jgi:hypothetical protein